MYYFLNKITNVYFDFYKMYVYDIFIFVHSAYCTLQNNALFV